MAKTDFKSVDEYLATFPSPVQKVLRKVRATIRKALPGAEEVISYQIPAYRLHGGAVIYFAGWKKHWSLYPVSAKLLTSLDLSTDDLDVDKGTLRFPLDEVPVTLVTRIAKARAAECAKRPRG
jgi:uncharacterized protein YdhG (YjbR/CyaY superfamily)